MHVSKTPNFPQLSKGFLLRHGSPEQQSQTRALLDRFTGSSLPEVHQRLGQSRGELAWTGAALTGAGVACGTLLSMAPWSLDLSMVMGVATLASSFVLGAGMLLNSLRCHLDQKALEEHASSAQEHLLEDGPLPGSLRDWRFRDEGALSHLSEVRDKGSDELLLRSARVGAVSFEEDARQGKVWVRTPSGESCFPGRLELPAPDEDTLKLHSGFCTQVFDVRGNSWLSIVNHRAGHEFRVAGKPTQGSDWQVTWSDGSIVGRGIRARPLVSAEALGSPIPKATVGEELRWDSARHCWNILSIESPDPSPGEMVPTLGEKFVGRLFDFKSLGFSLRTQNDDVLLLQGSSTRSLEARWDEELRQLEFEYEGLQARQCLADPETVSVALETRSGRVEIKESVNRPATARLFWGRDERGKVEVEVTDTGYAFQLEGQEYRLDPPVQRREMFARSQEGLA